MVWAIAVQPGVNHLTQIVLAGRAGISDSRATFRGYIGPLTATMVLGAWTAAIMNRLLAADVLAVIGLVVVSALISAVLFLQRERIPAFRIAKELGLLNLRES